MNQSIPVQKTVAVVFKKIQGQMNILVFEHPSAGIQIVKGTVEKNESIEQATLRELYEESGIKNATIQSYLGIHYPKQIGPFWHVFICNVNDELPASWTHFCKDDGGLDFKFYWHPLNQPPSDQWHMLFKDLLDFILATLYEQKNSLIQ